MKRVTLVELFPEIWNGCSRTTHPINALFLKASSFNLLNTGGYQYRDSEFFKLFLSAYLPLKMLQIGLISSKIAYVRNQWNKILSKSDFILFRISKCKVMQLNKTQKTSRTSRHRRELVWIYLIGFWNLLAFELSNLQCTWGIFLNWSGKEKGANSVYRNIMIRSS